MKVVPCTICLILVCLCVANFATATEARVVNAVGDQCVHGLHPQPNRGPFSVFLFCDDGLASNVGIILTERGAGPGNVPLDDTKVWHAWDTTDRFWQDAAWAADVVNFAWGPSQRYLYVATSAVYGDGAFFKLDLRERTHVRLPAGQPSPFETRIMAIDVEKKELSVQVSVAGSNGPQVTTEVLPLE